MSTKMTTESFNKLLSEFITDLSMTFTEYPQLEEARNQMNSLIDLDVSNALPMTLFHETLSPHVNLVMSRDPNLFDKIEIPMTQDFDMSTSFKESDETTQNAIWEYVQQLVAISTTVKTMPADVLKNIDQVTESCLSKIRDGEITEEEAQNPMFIMQVIQDNPEIMKALQTS